MIYDKIIQPGSHLKCTDLSPNQKKHLYAIMTRYGATPGFSYNRFFKEGFREWELLGIDHIKEDFLRLHEGELRDSLGGDDADISTGGDCFYDLIGRARLKLTFVSYMNSLGMGNNTVLERFGKSKECDFKEFERIGVKTVIREFEREIRELNIV